ncbi:thiol:disulfide interchange protein DsbA/DsbL [Variovorax sp. OV329]|uniref:thiol:disulfide interchange protein DsbA/DsbL n=1 Tax=Variovorax sp. OV329 TaxID=1882825 RepID=UPI0008E77510|nr:thiol:disulfide interchange protein DsbA/DsbL [Variovorax sp. OV329]SFM82422.1 thiol:disulfide interchange protein DsbA [Variovorax sp. OV329]
MKRRDFSLAAASAGLAPFVASTAAHAQAAAFKAGTDYIALRKPAPVDAPAGKVEVVEFFSYNCPHCAEFEPQLEAWIKKLPPHVAFRRIPVAFVGNDVESKQRLYYTLEAMGKVDEFQNKIFQAIHKQRQPLFGDAAILDWATKQPGLDGQKFAEMYKSFTVSGKVKRATQLQNDYQVGGVPALGVAGRYYIDGELSRSMDRALQITDYLIGEARKG